MKTWNLRNEVNSTGYEYAHIPTEGKLNKTQWVDSTLFGAILNRLTIRSFTFKKDF